MVTPIKTKSLSAFPWFLALHWPLCLCQKAASLKHYRGKKDKTIVPPTRQWSRLHSAISNVGRRQCPAEFSTCCYSSRKNEIPAALQRFISKSHLLPKRTLTLCCPFPEAETPGTNPKVFSELEVTVLPFIHPFIYQTAIYFDSVRLVPRFSLGNHRDIALGVKQDGEQDIKSLLKEEYTLRHQGYKGDTPFPQSHHRNGNNLPKKLARTLVVAHPIYWRRLQFFDSLRVLLWQKYH